MTTTTARPLLRILGLGFGLAVVFGTMVGVGILRLPGTVAAALGSPALIMTAWAIGGVFSLMCAVSVAELAAMIPENGGFRIYARRAFGEGIGFVIGCVDWLGSVATLAYAPVTAVAFIGILWPPAISHSRLIAISILIALTALHWIGLRVGSLITQVVSTAMGLQFLVLLAACFLVPLATAGDDSATTPVAAPLLSAGVIFALVPALRAILTAYDGWYAPIYTAEENTNASRTLPRAIIGGTLLVVVLYLSINLAFLHVLPPAALAVTGVAALVMILTGTFEQILALFAVLFLIYYVSAFLAVFVLRHTAPSTVRPYKALGYPFSTGIALLGSVSLLIAAVAEDPRSGEIATGCLILCAAAYWSISRRRRIRALTQVA